jgi:hypothetical protein
MNSRERGTIWPFISVAAGAFFVLIVMPLLAHRQRSSRMATVDAQVSIGDAGSDAPANRNAPAYRWPSGEVPRTAERLRDVSAVAISAITCVTEGAITGHTPHDAGEILSRLAGRQLIPTEWLTNEVGVLQMPHASIHLRYSPSTLVVEVLSVPNDRTDGPAILVRVPDQENTAVGSRYFESMQLDGIVYPHPFAPISEVISAGWQQRLFKQTRMSDAEQTQLEQWARTTIRQ